MSNVEKRTFTIAREHAEFLDQQVASGAYASPNEVIEAGLAALEDRQAGVEKWLREKVLPTAKAFAANPESGIPADAFFEQLYSRMAAKLKD